MLSILSSGISVWHIRHLIPLLGSHKNIKPNPEKDGSLLCSFCASALEAETKQMVFFLHFIGQLFNYLIG